MGTRFEPATEVNDPWAQAERIAPAPRSPMQGTSRPGMSSMSAMDPFESEGDLAIPDIFQD